MSNVTRKRVTERWGIPFWQLISDIHEQGFNRTQAAAIVGMQRRYFSALINAHPQDNPWGSSNVVANYVRDTGEPFRDALLRMQREGYSLAAAGRAIGFVGGGGDGLRHATKARGIDVRFDWVRPVKQTPRRLDKGPNVTTGWPTWDKIAVMLRPASQ